MRIATDVLQNRDSGSEGSPSMFEETTNVSDTLFNIQIPLLEPVYRYLPLCFSRLLLLREF